MDLTKFKLAKPAIKEIMAIIGISHDAAVSALDIAMPLDDMVRIKVEFIVTEEQWRQIGSASKVID